MVGTISDVWPHVKSMWPVSMKDFACWFKMPKLFQTGPKTTIYKAHRTDYFQRRWQTIMHGRIQCWFHCLIILIWKKYYMFVFVLHSQNIFMLISEPLMVPLCSNLRPRTLCIMYDKRMDWDGVQTNTCFSSVFCTGAFGPRRCSLDLSGKTAVGLHEAIVGHRGWTEKNTTWFVFCDSSSAIATISTWAIFSHFEKVVIAGSTWHLKQREKKIIWNSPLFRLCKTWNKMIPGDFLVDLVPPSCGHPPRKRRVFEQWPLARIWRSGFWVRNLVGLVSKAAMCQKRKHLRKTGGVGISFFRLPNQDFLGYSFFLTHGQMMSCHKHILFRTIPFWG